MEHYYNKRRTNWASKVLLLLVFLIILGYFTDALRFNFDNVGFDNVKKKFDNLKSNEIGEGSNKVKQPITEDKFISDCKEDFKYYENVFEKKYGMLITISEIKKIDDMNGADEFLNIWGMGRQDLMDREFTVLSDIKTFPVIMIAVSFRTPDRIKIPLVLICGNDAKLTEKSKQQLIS